MIDDTGGAKSVFGPEGFAVTGVELVAGPVWLHVNTVPAAVGCTDSGRLAVGGLPRRTASKRAGRGSAIGGPGAGNGNVPQGACGAVTNGSELGRSGPIGATTSPAFGPTFGPI